jgi:hypothetical protein
MKHLYPFVVAVLVLTGAKAQSCLPEGITFTTQAQIDNFQVNNPGCFLIEGNVIINGINIRHLDSLNVLIAVGGSLEIWENDSLTNLTGLENITSIGGNLRIVRTKLTSLTGLEGVTTIGGLDILSNYALTNLSGLDNVSSIDGEAWIQYNPVLERLTGLDALLTIKGPLTIRYNNYLTSLTGLDHLSSIEGYVDIDHNPHLTNLTGLDLLSSIGQLTISDNSALASLTGLGNLTSTSSLSIQSNNALTSLNGCEKLTNIGGSLWIQFNPVLSSLSGLDNLLFINSSLDIDDNPSLTSLSGLGNLRSISLNFYLSTNDVLSSLTGLNKLTYIGGDIDIHSNHALTSLSGLDNIPGNWIDNLSIYYNTSLSTCNVKSICEYLASPNGTVNIHNNKIGCNDQEEVIEACKIGVNENVTTESHISIYSNPASTTITIETPTTPNKNTFMTIYNINGQQLIFHKITKPATVIDVGKLPQGIYIVKVKDDQAVLVSKFIKQ